MDSYEKFLILGSLSFFFGCLITSLAVLNYKHSFPRLDNVPNSVMHYPVNAHNRTNDVFCYIDNDYKKQIEERRLFLAATAQMENDRLEIYTDSDNGFHAFVIGPDAAGSMEACEVANGSSWKTEAN